MVKGIWQSLFLFDMDVLSPWFIAVAAFLWPLIYLEVLGT